MNILFTICGRAGSKGLKNKNCLNFLNIPLPYYTFAAISLYDHLHGSHTVQTVLNTDSDQLADLARTWDPHMLIIPRNPEHAGDNAAKLPVIQDTLCKAETLRGVSYDCVVDLDITSPLRTAQNIAESIKKQVSEGYDVVFSATEARRNPYFNMVKQLPDGSCEKVLQSDYTARQQAPAMFDMNASIYAYSPDFLKSNTSGSLFNGKCSFVEMRDTGVLDIDSEHDFLLMEAVAAFLITQDAGLNDVFKTAGKGRDL